MKLAICNSHFSNSQISYNISRELNKKYLRPSKFNYVAFTEDYSSLMVDSAFPIYPVYDMFGFDGSVISMDLSTTDIMLNCPQIKNKFFYVNDLEWIRSSNGYYFYAQFYRNPKIQLITRSNDYAEKIEKTWNTKVLGVVEDFNLDKMEELICQQMKI